MEVYQDITAFRAALDHVRAARARRADRRAGAGASPSVGLVPTMGALHDGHVSLLARARDECPHVAATIFVNPLQFGDPLDLHSYPRTLASDLEQCEAAGVASVFAPSIETMYPDWPEPPATTVSVGRLGDDWEGKSRPGHFDGVATVVAKLFAIAGPCRAYFGEKDFQQLSIVRRMVTDLSLPVEVVGCPTVRDSDGLALSSRNVRLTHEQRAAAVVLPRALDAGAALIAAGEERPARVGSAMAAVIDTEPLAVLDYAALVDSVTLEVPERIALPTRRRDPARSGSGSYRLLVAARFGEVRLIDNAAVARGTEPTTGLAPLIDGSVSSESAWLAGAPSGR
ncbi:MAG: pantoate--beta-alanine ligase [Actinomycetota bacterium]|jgi:pantoate--beta-alanine ligase|nr:pantoate--beta-alanine ligase [Actinomycetota bacterium]